MKFYTKATNIKLTPAIEEYLDKHLVAHLGRFVKRDDDSVSLSIEVGKTTRHHHKGEVFRAEVNLHIAGRDLRAEAERDDLHAAIDKVKDEITRELTSYRKKTFHLLKRGGQKIKNFLKGFGRER